jgi:hypothetical protein
MTRLSTRGPGARAAGSAVRFGLDADTVVVTVLVTVLFTVTVFTDAVGFGVTVNADENTVIVFLGLDAGEGEEDAVEAALTTPALLASASLVTDAALPAETPFATALAPLASCGRIAKRWSAILLSGGPGKTKSNGPLNTSTVMPASLAWYAPGKRTVSADEGDDEPEPDTRSEEHEMKSSGGEMCFAMSSCRRR